VSSLLDARVKLGALLAPATDDDPDVHDNIVDALVPPCLVVGWRAPMVIDRATCFAYGELFVMLVAGRIDVAAGIETLETLYDYTETRLRGDAATGWTIPSDTGPILWELANTSYLACRVDVLVPIEIP
jgi:hypothetical protein